MISKQLLEKYAELTIVKGVNLQENQTLIINTCVEAVEMTRACVKAAYQHGAKQVLVFYSDDVTIRLDYEHQNEETMMDVHPWQIDCKLDYLKEGACLLHIISEIPGILKGLDADKISKKRLAMATAGKEMQSYPSTNKTQWCIVAVPNIEWARKVFPNIKDDEKAVQALWDKILFAVHVDEENDPITEWTDLNTSFQKRVNILNEYAFSSLKFKNAKGTDLEVCLPNHHIWAGGCDTTITTEVDFNPNMPTEEIFTTPHRCHVNGKVFASKPLVYNGNLIEDFWIEFKDGKAIAYDAKEGKDSLQALIEFDEGSCRLGEVALVPYDSPISQSGVLFYNTLFDENASCHLALGSSYANNIEHGAEMSDEELQDAGGNVSLTHVDFMFGTKDMHITGLTEDGNEVVIFENGNFVF